MGAGAAGGRGEGGRQRTGGEVLHGGLSATKVRGGDDAAGLVVPPEL
eukprot:COSAG04_NODE_26504_length_294_cov_0.784615_1_plen_46_part_01